MDDINFDELDKAVNSALQQKPKKEERAENVSTHDESVSHEETSHGEADKIIAEKPSIIVPKRRGQFMDVVHPSSDMTTPPTIRPATTSRQAAILQPLDPSVVEAVAKDESKPSPENKEEVTMPFEKGSARTEAEDEGAKTQGTETTEKPQEEKVAVHTNEWPDPLDVMTDAEEKTEEDAEQEKFEPHEEAVKSTQEEKPAEKDISVAGSPFISGTEVEKRPLGAFTDADEVKEPEVHVPAVLPEELAPEIISVESDDSTTFVEQTETNTDTASSTTGMSESISQQYTPTASPNDETEDHPVFDTKEYHQPLTPPAKKSHGGPVAFFIILFIALLAGTAWYAIAVLKLL